MADAQLLEGLANEGQDTGHPDDEGTAVVAHQLERCAAQLKAVAEPAQDRLGLRQGQHAQLRETGRAQAGQQGVEGMVVERIDLAPAELGRQVLRVPVGQQAHDDDRLSTQAGRRARAVRAGDR